MSIFASQAKIAESTTAARTARDVCRLRTARTATRAVFPDRASGQLYHGPRRPVEPKQHGEPAVSPQASPFLGRPNSEIPNARPQSETAVLGARRAGRAGNLCSTGRGDRLLASTGQCVSVDGLRLRAGLPRTDGAGPRVVLLRLLPRERSATAVPALLAVRLADGFLLWMFWVRRGVSLRPGVWGRRADVARRAARSDALRTAATSRRTARSVRTADAPLAAGLAAPSTKLPLLKQTEASANRSSYLGMRSSPVEGRLS